MLKLKKRGESGVSQKERGRGLGETRDSTIHFLTTGARK